MAIEKIFAHISCSSLEHSKQWYTALFGRPADAEQMQHLVEWHHGSNAGIQLFENAPAAGKNTVTFIVSALREEHERLTSAGLRPNSIENGEQVSLVRLNDPDGNLVVLAQPGCV